MDRRGRDYFGALNTSTGGWESIRFTTAKTVCRSRIALSGRPQPKKSRICSIRSHPHLPSGEIEMAAAAYAEEAGREDAESSTAEVGTRCWSCRSMTYPAGSAASCSLDAMPIHSAGTSSSRPSTADLPIGQ